MEEINTRRHQIQSNIILEGLTTILSTILGSTYLRAANWFIISASSRSKTSSTSCLSFTFYEKRGEQERANSKRRERKSKNEVRKEGVK